MATSLEDLFATDLNAEENGTWVELGDMKFLIRAYSCKAAVDLRDKLQRPYQAILRTPNGKIPDDVSEDINLKVLAGGILADWSIIEQDSDGNATAVKFTPEAAYTKMKKMPRFAAWVAQQAIDTQNYKDAVTADALGN